MSLNSDHGRRHWSPFEILMVAAVILLALVLRAYHLGFKPIWLDEAVVYWIARMDPRDLLAANAINNSAPPFYALILHLIIPLGDSEVALRLPSLIGGVLGVGAVYLLAREFLPQLAATSAAIFAATAPSQVQLSQQVREYGLTFLFATAALWLFVRIMREEKKKWWVLLTTILVLGTLLQYGVVILIAALNLIFVITVIQRPDRRSMLRPWIVSQLIVGTAAFLDYELALKHQMPTGGFGAQATVNYLAAGYWAGTGESLRALALDNTRQIVDFAFQAPPYYLILAVMGLLYALATPRLRAVAALTLVPLGITFALACLRFYPYLGARQSMFLTPMLYVCGGCGIALLQRVDRRGGLGVLVALFLTWQGASATYDYLQDTGREDVRTAATALLSSLQPDDRIYVYYSASYSTRYYLRDHPEVIRNQLVEGRSSRGEPERYLRQWDEILATRGRVWMVQTHCYANECTLMRDYVGALRPVTLVREGRDNWLYLVDDTRS